VGKEESCVGVVGIGSSPVSQSRDGRSAGGLSEEGASGELGGAAECVEEGKEMDVDKVIDKVGSEAKGAAAG
jgi:hypothetical protein